MSAARHDIIVLLGCRVGPGLSLSAAAQRRAEAAARLWHAGAAPQLLVSGGKPSGGVTEAAAIAAELVRLGVPRACLVLEDASNNTVENVLRSRPLLRARGARRLALVSCDSHLPRASVLFRAAGFEVRCHGAGWRPGSSSAERQLRRLTDGVRLARDLPCVLGVRGAELGRELLERAATVDLG